MLVIAIAPSRCTSRSRSAVTSPSADSRATSASTRSPAGETDTPGRTARCAVPGSSSNSSRTRSVRSGGTVTRSCINTEESNPGNADGARPWGTRAVGGEVRSVVLRGRRTGARGVVRRVADLGAGRGALCADRCEGAQQDLAHVQDLDVVLRLAVLLLGVQRVAQHRDAERAGGGDDVGVELERLLGALGVNPLADLLLHPHARAAGAAAEAAVLAAVHLLGGEALDGVQDLARRRVDLVVPPEEARVVVGDLAVDRRDRGEPALLDQLAQQLRVVDDLVLAADLRVLPAERVEAVRAGRDDLAGARHATLEDAVQRLDVLHGQLLEDELVAHAAGRVAGAGLTRTQDGELDAGDVHELGDGLRDLLRAVVDGACAAHPEQVLDLVGDRPVDHPDLEVELLDPFLADVAAHAPRVAPVLEVAQHHAGLGREVRLDQRLVAAHVEDVVDVLDVDRALLDAGAAVRAAPQDVGVDDPALLERADQRAVGLRVVGALDAGVAGRPRLLVAGLQDVEVGSGLAGRLRAEQVRGLGVEVVPQVHDQHLGAERLAGVPGRALALAPPALGAGGEVQHPLPGEVLDLAPAEDVVLAGILEVDRLAAAGHGGGRGAPRGARR